MAIALYLIWGWHSDATRERMWHYLMCVYPVRCVFKLAYNPNFFRPAMGAIPCFAVWLYVGIQQNYDSISPIGLYGLAFLGNLVSIAQPAALAYRTSTLYGAAEQAVGGASAVAALSIASIIGPQVR